MDQDLIQLIVALGGIATFIISVVVGILFFTYSGPPPAKNVLLRDFLNLFASVSFVVFTTGFAYLSIAARPNYAWMGLLMAVFSLVFITTTL
ncbi:MAG TPA: hypothetical protein VFM05_08985, partial [Candidatus Saccharimonadales bacterium]|nr:hypothetical protein [Candidatus Saccharimonadales bacterium]